MTNEMKLLRAFIEASGYEIETTPRIIEAPGPLVKTMLVTDYKVTKKEPPDIPMTMIEAEEFLRKYDKANETIITQ